MGEPEQRREQAQVPASEDNAASALPVSSEDGVDLTLIRWMLSLTPGQRLEWLEQFVNSVQRLRRGLP
jgi:hypothetical protein